MVRFNWQDPTLRRTPPKPWSVRLRLAVNRVAERWNWPLPFQLTGHDLIREPPPWRQSLQRNWRSFSQSTFPYALLLLSVTAGAAVLWRLVYPALLPELWPEMVGTSLEIFFLILLLGIFEARRSHSQLIERQRETIEDYKRWDDPEAHVRIAGAIRRLNRMHVFAVDFSALQLSDFSFAKHGIERLAGSSFYDGAWGQPMRETGISLTKVAFDHVDCADVEFSPFDPFEGLWADGPRYAKLRDCTFVDSNLRGARFNGASLDWSEPPPNSHYEVVGESEGSPGLVQVSVGPFDRADLSGAWFRACRFTNADFRNARGLLAADFFRATGLESAKFDDEETKAAVLANANRPEQST